MESCSWRLTDLNPLQSQLLRGAMKISLPSQSTNGFSVPRGVIWIGLSPRDSWNDFLEQIRESNKLGHERNDWGKGVLQGTASPE